MEAPQFSAFTVDCNKNKISQYLSFDGYAKQTYGESSLVLMKVGEFYEIYEQDGMGANLELVSNITQCDVYVDASGKFRGVGFLTMTLDANVQLLLTTYKYIIRVDEIDKDKTPKRQIRRIVRVYTDGTFTQEKEYNAKSMQKLSRLNIQNKASVFPLVSHIYIYIPHESTIYTPIIIVIASVSIEDGESHIFEVCNRTDDQNYALDCAIAYFERYQPKMIQISTKYGKDTEINTNTINYIIRSIKEASKLPDDCIHINNEIPAEYYKLSYQKQLLSKIYKNTGSLSPIQYIGLEKSQQSVVSFILLLQSIYEKYPVLIDSINKPTLLKKDNVVELSIDAINQLSVYKDLNDEKSVYDILNHTKTHMGSRQLLSRLLYPIYDNELLVERYEIIEYLQSRFDNDYKVPVYNIITSKMADFVDMDKVHRKFVLGTITPSNIYGLISNYEQIQEIISCCKITKNKRIVFTKDDKLKLNELIDSLKVLNLDKCRAINNINNTEINIFNKDYDTSLDKLFDTLEHVNKVKSIIIGELEKLFITKKNKNTKILSWSMDEKGRQLYLDITKVRFDKLKALLRDNPITLSINDDLYTFSSQNFNIYINKKKDVSISTNEIDALSALYFETIKTFNTELKSRYMQFIASIHEKYGDFMRTLSRKVGEIDVMCSLAFIAKKYNYCKPELVRGEDSFVEFENLRHALVERELELNGYGKDNYIPHSFILGKITESAASANLMLLYGSNMCGKSTFLRGVGIAVILAQIGSYVPAEKFIFSPFKSVYTRILTKDNIHKSRSSFQQEMIELSPILKRSDSNSLVLADEPCHSTNQTDAYSIVLASLEEIGKTGCCGVITTHIHELADDNDLLKISGLRVFNLSIELKQDKVIYTRQLKPGVGLKCYGVEVASQANISDSVISRAHQIRRKLLHMNDKFLSFKTSNYSSNIYMDTCEVCGKTATETHHMLPQSSANENGFVDHIPIHSTTNLKQLCEECHAKITFNY